MLITKQQMQATLTPQQMEHAHQLSAELAAWLLSRDEHGLRVVLLAAAGAAGSITGAHAESAEVAERILTDFAGCYTQNVSANFLAARGVVRGDNNGFDEGASVSLVNAQTGERLNITGGCRGSA